MKIFVAGGSGTIGIPLVRAFVASGHRITALTRSPGKSERLQALGAAPAVADALDRDALLAAVEATQPTLDVRLTSGPEFGQGARNVGEDDASVRFVRLVRVPKVAAPDVQGIDPDLSARPSTAATISVTNYCWDGMAERAESRRVPNRAKPASGWSDSTLM